MHRAYALVSAWELSPGDCMGKKKEKTKKKTKKKKKKKKKKKTKTKKKKRRNRGNHKLRRRAPDRREEPLTRNRRSSVTGRNHTIRHAILVES